MKGAINAMVPLNSPDAILAGGSSGRIGLWLPPSHGPARSVVAPTEVLSGHDKGEILALAVREGGYGGTVAASGGSDHQIKLWGIGVSEPPRPPLLGHSGEITSLAFSPTGEMLFSASLDGAVGVWALAGLPQLCCMLEHREQRALRTVAVMPSGRLLAYDCSDCVHVWHVEEKKHLRAIPLSDRSSQEEAQRLLQESNDGFSVRKGDSTVLKSSRESVATLVPLPAILPSGEEAVLICADGWKWPQIWSLTEHGALPVSTLHAEANPSHLLCPTPAGVGKVVTATLKYGDRIVVTFEHHAVIFVACKEDRDTLLLQTDKLELVDYHTATASVKTASPDAAAQHFATGGMEGTVKMWEVSGTPRLVTTLPGHANGCYSLAYADSWPILFSGGADDTIKMWQLPAGNLLGHWPRVHLSGVTALAVPADGTLLASGGGDGTAIIWSVTMSEEARLAQLIHLGSHGTEAVETLAFADGAQRLAVGCGIEAFLYTLDRQRSPGVDRAYTQLTGHIGAIVALAFVGTDQLLSASRDTTLRLWHAPSGDCLSVMEHHTAPLTCLSLIDGGRRALSGSEDHVICHWDVPSRAYLGSLLRHSHEIIGIHCGNNQVVSIDLAGSIFQWDLAPLPKQRLLGNLCGAVRHIALVPAPIKRLARTASDLRKKNEQDQISSTLPSSHVITADDSGGLRMWDAETGELLHVFIHYGDVFTAMAVSGDGQVLAVTDKDGILTAWNIPNRIVAVANVHLHAADLALDGTGRILMAVTGGGNACTLDLGVMGTLRRSCVGPEALLCVAATSDGRSFITGGVHGVYIWDNISTDSPKCTKLPCHVTHVWHVHPQGAYLSLLSSQVQDFEGASFLSPSDKEQLRATVKNPPHGHKAPPAVPTSGKGDGDHGETPLDLARLLRGKTRASIWSLNLPNPLAVLEIEGERRNFSSVTLLPGAVYALTTCTSGKLAVWDIKTGRLLYECVAHKNTAALCAAVCSDGTHVISGGGDNAARLWRLRTTTSMNLKLVQQFADHTSAIIALAVSTDGTRVVSAAADGGANIWNIAENSKVRPLPGVRQLALTSDGSFIVGIHDTDGLCCWELADGKEGFSPVRPSAAVDMLAVCATSHLIALGAHYGSTVWLHDTSKNGYNGQVDVLSARIQGGGIVALAFTPDGSYLVMACLDGQLRTLNCSTLSVVQDGFGARGPQDRIAALLVTPDGRMALFGGRSKVVHICNIRSRTYVASLHDSRGAVVCLAMAPDGKHVFVGREGGIVQMWDVPQRCHVASLAHGGQDAITSLAVTADGSLMLAGTAGGHICCWHGRAFLFEGAPQHLPREALMATIEADRRHPSPKARLAALRRALSLYPHTLTMTPAPLSAAAAALPHPPTPLPMLAWAASVASYGDILDACLDAPLPVLDLGGESALLHVALHKARDRSVLTKVTAKIAEAARSSDAVIGKSADAAGAHWKLLLPSLDERFTDDVITLVRTQPDVAASFLAQLGLVRVPTDASFKRQVHMREEALLVLPSNARTLLDEGGFWAEADGGDKLKALETADALPLAVETRAVPLLNAASFVGEARVENSLLQALVSAQRPDLFGNYIARAIVHYKWRTYGFRKAVWRTSWYLLQLAMLTALAFLAPSFDVFVVTRVSNHDPRQWVCVGLVVCLILAAMFELGREVRQHYLLRAQARRLGTMGHSHGSEDESHNHEQRGQGHAHGDARHHGDGGHGHAHGGSSHHHGATSKKKGKVGAVAASQSSKGHVEGHGHAHAQQGSYPTNHTFNAVISAWLEDHGGNTSDNSESHGHAHGGQDRTEAHADGHSHGHAHSSRNEGEEEDAHGHGHGHVHGGLDDAEAYSTKHSHGHAHDSHTEGDTHGHSHGHAHGGQNEKNAHSHSHGHAHGSGGAGGHGHGHTHASDHEHNQGVVTSQSYFADLWNIIELMHCALALSMGVLFLLGEPHARTMLALALYVKWLGVLSYMQPFEATGPLVRMIIAILFDVRYFILVLAVAVAATWTSLTLLLPKKDGRERLGDAGNGLYITFNMLLLGDFESDLFDGEYVVLVRLLFVFTMVLVSIVLLNLLIAIMGDSYTRISEKADLEFQALRASILLEQELFMTRKERANPRNFPRWLQVLVPSGKGVGQTDSGAVWQGVLGAIEERTKEQEQEAVARHLHLERQLVELQHDVGTIQGRLYDMHTQAREAALAQRNDEGRGGNAAVARGSFDDDD
jgi:WD40 repeat protein